MRSTFLFSHLIIATLLLSCSSCHIRTNNPPKADLPLPQPHSGVFVSGADTLFFNGDGESVGWHFAEGLDNLGTQGSGTYVFLFDGGAWRYDAAERFDIFTPDQRRESFHLGVPGSCTDSTICILQFDSVGNREKEVCFKKQSN